MQLDLKPRTTLEHVRGFLEGNSAGSVLVSGRQAACEHGGKVRRRFSPWKLGKGGQRPAVPLLAAHRRRFAGTAGAAVSPALQAGAQPAGRGDRRAPRQGVRAGCGSTRCVRGDLDRVKGAYHIDVVNGVTQYRFVGTVERISERFLLPPLEGFSCSGSEGKEGQ